jgi:hypothetical protein
MSITSRKFDAGHAGQGAKVFCFFFFKKEAFLAFLKTFGFSESYCRAAGAADGATNAQA